MGAPPPAEVKMGRLMEALPVQSIHHLLGAVGVLPSPEGLTRCDACGPIRRGPGFSGPGGPVCWHVVSSSPTRLKPHFGRQACSGPMDGTKAQG